MVKSIKQIFTVTLSAVCMLFFFGMHAAAQDLTADDIIMKNVEAVGGMAKINALGAVSFEIAGPPPNGIILQRVFAKGNDSIKSLSGASPLVESIMAYNKGTFSQKSFVSPSETEEIDKANLRCYTPLYTAGFSLYNYRGMLTLAGLKKYGPEKHYILDMKDKTCNLRFSVDSESFLVVRSEMANGKSGIDKFTIAYDFRYPDKKESLFMPTSFYRSDLGVGASARGAEVVLQNFKSNLRLQDNYFAEMELNYGTVKAETGKITGNATLAIFVAPRYAAIVTNIAAPDTKNAGFKPNDTVVFEYAGEKYESLFLNSTRDITSALAQPGKIILAQSAQNQYLVLVLFGPQFEKVTKSYKPLLKINITKK